MTDKNDLYSGISLIAWGYVLMYFDLKLGSVSITPAFVGYLLFLYGIHRLDGECRNIHLLFPLGVLLALIYAADWMASWVGTMLFGKLRFLDALSSAAAIYFHFQLLTDLTAIASKYVDDTCTADVRLLRWRNINTLFQTATNIFLYLPALSPRLKDMWEFISITLMLIGILIAICIVACLFSLRRFLRTTPDA